MATYNAETGEVIEDGARPRASASRRRRGPPRATRALSDVDAKEHEARERWRERKTAERARTLELIESLVPSLPTDVEPRAQNERLIEIDGRTGRGTVLCEVERANGSRVALVAKHYDGALGRAARDYVHLSVWYRTGVGAQFRTRGVALENVDEARAMAHAILAWADALEAQ